MRDEVRDEVRTTRSPTTRLLLRAAAVALALAGAGCTSAPAGAPATGDPDEPVRAAAERMFTSSDEQDCTTLYTEAALEQMVGTDDPVAACRATLPATETAGSVQVEDLDVAGDQASVRVTPDGGGYGGLAVDLALVRTDGAWRVDRISDLEVLDQQVVLAPIHDGLEESVGDSLRPEDLDCIDAVLGAIPDAEVEQLLLERQMGQRGIDALRQCLGAGQDLLTLFALLNNQLLNAGASEADAACVAGYMTDFFADWTIEEVLADPTTYRQQADAEIVRVTETSCTG